MAGLAYLNYHMAQSMSERGDYSELRGNCLGCLCVHQVVFIMKDIYGQFL